MSAGGDHGSDLAAFELEAKTLKQKSDKGDFSGQQKWASDRLNSRIFGLFNALILVVIFFSWVISPGYNSVLLTSSFLLINILYLIVKLRRKRELEKIRQIQLDVHNRSSRKSFK